MFSTLDSFLETVTKNGCPVTDINRVALMSWVSIENYPFCSTTLFFYIVSILLLPFATIARNRRGRRWGVATQVDNTSPTPSIMPTGRSSNATSTHHRKTSKNRIRINLTHIKCPRCPYLCTRKNCRKQKPTKETLNSHYTPKKKNYQKLQNWNPILTFTRKEDDDVGSAVGGEQQEFEAWIVRGRWH